PDEGEIARVLDRVLAGWSGEAPRVTPQPNPAKGSYHHEQDDSAQVQIVLLHDGPPEPSPDAIAERVVTSVLSGGMAARLFSEVREKRGLCYAVSASYGTERTYGRSLAYVGTTPERAQQSLEVLLAELARINRPEGTVSEDEFARALTGIQANLVFAGESTGARAAALASDQLKIGRPRPLDELRARYRALTLGDVRAYLARRELGEVTVVTLGPAALRVPERS
ncbi:MAG TPA: insulinase family protein, partial [Phycisphaerales bacterium]|nr:insulinase family protein [Phycisphaerales bacterium]